MAERLPNFIYGAIYRSESGRADASASASAPRFKCYSSASPDIPKNAYVADCCVCDAFGRVDPGLSISPIPIRKEALGPNHQHPLSRPKAVTHCHNERHPRNHS